MFTKISLVLKAARQLGWAEIGPYLRYRLQLKSGLLRWRTPPARYVELAEDAGEIRLPVFRIPNAINYRQLLADQAELLICEADQILDRQVRLFGGETVPLRLALGADLDHWTRHTTSQFHGEDIKLVWEPARFGWATVLARASHLSGNFKYAQAFWQFTEEFLAANPPNIGPHWASGQEVALRLMAMAFSAGLLTEMQPSTPERLELFRGAVAAHAQRIMATLDYARAQNNNHLISEAAGLYTAAALLPDHPRSKEWYKAGWAWLNHALQTQISPEGVYIQHSSNYLRLVLQLALFVRRIASERGDKLPELTCQRLAAATRWLAQMLDQDSGGVPNLGGNDGAYFLPLTTCPYADFRPVLNAARFAFLGEDVQQDEIGIWLAGEQGPAAGIDSHSAVLRLEGGSSWGVLRAVRFEHRPAHADQLHLDLWWRGKNIAVDPGVYQYNADPPWHNPLDTSAVHNTLTINGWPQMTKAGQFLWLDWAQAQVLDQGELDGGALKWVTAQHDGYRKLKLVHRRTVSVEGNLWTVRDQVLPMEGEKFSQQPAAARLHWLLPDWKWQFNDGRLRLNSGGGAVTIGVGCPEGEEVYSLVRAGEPLLGKSDTEAFRGWFSPTYGQKEPALSFAISVTAVPPLTITTHWSIPE